MDVLRSSSFVLASSHYLAGEPHGRRLSAPFHLPRSPSRTLFDASRQRLLRIRIVSRVAVPHDSSENSRRVLSAWTDKELARAVLFSFIGREGIDSGEIADVDLVVDLLASKLSPLRSSANPAGTEFTVVQLEDALTPYLELLLKKYRVCTDVVQEPPGPLAQVATATALSGIKAVAKLDRKLQEGTLPPSVLYLMSVGLNLNQIRKLTRGAPLITDVGVGRKLRHLVEFLLDLGVPQSRIPYTLQKAPLLLTASIEKKLKPNVAYLEKTCVDRSQWPRIIPRFPQLLRVSRRKLEKNVSYFMDEGGYNGCLGKLLVQYPQILAMRIDEKIKLTINFLLDKGFTIEEVRTITLRLPTIYSYNVEKSLVPKWEYFLVMGYPKSVLVSYPNYFGFNLKERIMPRYKLAMELGVQLSLHQLLSPSTKDFGKLLERKIRKRDSATLKVQNIT